MPATGAFQFIRMTLTKHKRTETDSPACVGAVENHNNIKRVLQAMEEKEDRPWY
jgi:hypothetical protein